ncbi:hypothetical protein [Aquimarina sp. I32.4]|uniref:hypothetical protein n=1 Tax=Aquimarina sp. I32.4 TaxID=2053903 RepID=UPI000CDF117B|nr:hypothetical protein [Aquimarina sp. I32.4]
MEEKYKNIRNLIKEAGVEKPPVNFIDNIMNQVNIAEDASMFVYKPLISKKVWWGIGLLLVLLLGSIPFLSDTKISLLSWIDFSFIKSLPNIKNPFSNYIFPKSTIYGILFLAILFFVQIPILKRRIDKNFSM